MSDAGCQLSVKVVEIRINANFSSDFRPLTSILVGLGGFEPPTSRLSGVRSRPTEL